MVAEPQMSTLLRIADENDRKGTELRGTPRFLDTVVVQQGSSATVSDCIDFADVASVRRGAAMPSLRHPFRLVMHTNFKRGTDGVWRVIFVKMDQKKC
jgi:hypothetical protein